MTTTIINLAQTRHPAAIRIDRATRWGNPYRIGEHGNRQEVIALYRVYLWNKIRSGEIPLDQLATLHGQTLACWCKPLPCHGDVLARAAQWAHSQFQSPTRRRSANPHLSHAQSSPTHSPRP